MIKVLCTLFWGGMLLTGGTLLAQNSADTLRYSSSEAEGVFLKNNLSLLAEKLNIQQANARIMQAKVWPNPTFTLDELQVYKNSTTDEIPPLFGNFWRDRNFAMQIEQLILTAGKRRKNIQFEMRNKELAEVLFTDVLQALKVELRQTVSKVRYLQQVQRSWQVQLQEVSRLIRSQEGQLREGHISSADLYRLKSLQLSLRGEIVALAEEMRENQKALKNLLFVDPASYIVILDGIDTDKINQLRQQPLEQYIGLAGNNGRLKAAQSQIHISEAQLEIERANRVPNVNLISSFDRNGSTMRNFVGVGAAVDLPIFNRNKGNILAARYEVEKNKLLQRQAATEVSNAIVKAWGDLREAIDFYDAIDKDYIEKLDQLTAAIGRNFSEHNISLLQFLDYYESFRESKEKYYSAIRNIYLKKDDISYLIGADL